MSSIFKRFSKSAPAHAIKQEQISSPMAEQLPPTRYQPPAKKPARPRSQVPPSSSNPVIANFDSAHLTLGAGVSIFHLATARCVLCYHPLHHYYFLPKGRKDTHESLSDAAQREGFEESGYRNRLLPVPVVHRQPSAHELGSSVGKETTEDIHLGKGEWATEAIWCQMMPVSRWTQYLLFWYVAETVPEHVERATTETEKGEGVRYKAPQAFEAGMTLRKRVEMEGKGYEPVRHEGTGVDEEEALYESSLVGIDEAIEKLGRGSVSADVVRRGWEAVRRRWSMEANGHAE